MGGLIYSLNTANLTLTNSVIRNSLAAQGSGVASNWGLLFMKNVTVYNSATIDVAAGLIGDGPGAQTTLINVYVYGSKAINQSSENNNGAGGAIFTMGSYLTIVDSVFDDCSGFLGGVISSFGTLGSPTATAQNSQLPNITLINTVMSNSTAQQGGAIQCQNCILTATNCSFIGNKATYAGGAIELEIWNALLCPTLFTGSAVFINNQVNTTGMYNMYYSQGGAIFMDSLANVTFATTNLTMLGNRAVLGSSIYNSDWHFYSGYEGELNYTPASDKAVVNIDGTVYYAHKDFANWAAQPENNPFRYSTTHVYSDSDFVGVSLAFPWLASLDYSVLPSNFSVPDLSFMVNNAFGIPVGFYLPTNFPFVMGEFAMMRNPAKYGVENVGDTVLTVYKGPANFSQPVVDFRGVTIDQTTLTDPKWNGTIKATYRLISNTDTAGVYQTPVVLHFNYVKK